LQVERTNIDDPKLSGQPETANVLGLRITAVKAFGTTHSRNEGIILLKPSGYFTCHQV